MKKTISAIFALSIAVSTVLDARPAKKDAEPLKVGILSDVHVNNEKTSEIFVKALEYFRDNDVDAVLIAGDMIGWGMEWQMELFSGKWYSVFPNDKGLNGKKVEKLFVYGNHEISGHKYGGPKKRYTPEEIEAQCIAPRRAEIWKKYFHEKFEPVYIKEIKGYKFIGAHFQNTKETPGLEDFFASVEKQLPKDKPFFYFQHTHPKGTTSGDTVWGQDNGKSTELLSRYPNVIAFSGHSHTTLTDEHTIHQGAFTSVGTASLAYNTVLHYGDYANGSVPKGGNSQMKEINKRASHQGMLMTVYPDRIELLRHEFGRNEDLGTWIIPLGTDEKPYAFDVHDAATPAPQFSSDAVVKLTRKPDGKDRKGNVVPQLWVSFPAVGAAAGGSRAFEFEVCAERTDSSSVVISRKVLARGCNLSESSDAGLVQFCAFADSELPASVPLRFAVYPVNSFGRKGTPVYSETITIK